MSDRFFTADPHLFHDRVSKLRGFDSSDEWNEYFADMWQGTVSKRDVVWLLGDMTGGGHVDEMLALMKSLPGTKHLILGNHEDAHPMHRNSHVRQRRYFEAFDSVQAFARMKIDANYYLMSHFPYVGDHTRADRYAQYRLKDEGAWLLHGHTHSTEVFASGPRNLHVGLDAWGYRLVPESSISRMRAS